MELYRTVSPKSSRTALAFLCTYTIALSPLLIAQSLDRSAPQIPDLRIERTRSGGDVNPSEKLSPELSALYDQFAETTRSEVDDSGLSGFTKAQLSQMFGIPSGDPNPSVVVGVRFSGTFHDSLIRSLSLTVIAKSENIAFVLIPIKNVGTLAALQNVRSLGVFKSLSTPDPMISNNGLEVRPLERSAASTVTRLATDFDKQRLTGKGVVIGVIDSGIDWRHEDFRREDGSSRILAIWDLTDTSYQDSGGSTGSKPPVYLESSKKWLGTVYTNAQINAANSGAGKVNSLDRFGHGTAVAGTAASNGRATANGVPSGTYAGVAPDADLIIVKAMDCGSFLPVSTLTAEWILSTAKALGKPAVVNMSYGGQFSKHDGTDEDELFIDSIVGPGKKGGIVTVSAGNDGRYSIRATGRFAPKRAGQADQISRGIDMQVKSPSGVLGVFEKTDDWGLVFRSTNPAFEGADGKSSSILVYRNGSGVDCEPVGAVKNRTQVDQFCTSLRYTPASAGEKLDSVFMRFPVGDYTIWGFGTGPTVPNGRFDLYLVEAPGLNKASFGTGAQKTEIIGSPGNAKNAITVGSYDFRGSWINREGETTLYNLIAGGISEYSSAGFRRDGHVKPDISAPARFMVSSLSQHAPASTGGCTNSMASGDGSSVTRDGYHLAWEGTSAAAPFVSGVIALMLQKNPGLDSEQIRSILKTTAQSGGKIGAVPNPNWGWGMIVPAAALRATPPPARGAPRRNRR